MKFQFNSTKDIDGVGQTNAIRAGRGEKAIYDAFKIHSKNELEAVNASDLIGDIFHLCDRNKWKIEGVVSIALANWRDER